MRKRTNNRLTNVALGILLGIILVAGLVFGALVLFDRGQDEDNSAQESSINDEVVDSVDDQYQSKDTIDDVDGEPSGGGEGDDTSTTSGSTMRVTLMAEYDAGKITAYNVIYGTVDYGGECVYTFTSPGGKSETVRTTALQNPSTVTCDRAEYEPSVLGTWQIKLEYKAQYETGAGYATITTQ